MACPRLSARLRRRNRRAASVNPRALAARLARIERILAAMADATRGYGPTACGSDAEPNPNYIFEATR